MDSHIYPSSDASADGDGPFVLALRSPPGALYHALVSAADDLAAHHLNLSLKWISEQIIGIDATSSIFPGLDTSSSSSSPSSSLPSSSPHGPDYPYILLAKALISSREYHRCFTTLLGGGGSRRVHSPLGLFLGYYSMYMAGEKTRDQVRCRTSPPALLCFHLNFVAFPYFTTAHIKIGLVLSSTLYYFIIFN